MTGGGRGIGEAIAMALASEGARVVIASRTKSELDAVSERGRASGLRIVPCCADVTKAPDVERLIGCACREGNGLDILVNNAGDLLARRTIADMTEEYWDQVMALNLKSAFLCAKAVWEEMAARKRGCIINISSIAGRNGGGPGAAAYAAAKGGLLTYTKGLAKELAPHGIRVNGVAPGVIATPYHDRYSPAELFQKYLTTIPMARAGTSEEVADVIVFLASPASRYMTGETVEVNGGQWMD